MKKLIFLLFVVMLMGCEPLTELPTDSTTVPVGVYVELQKDTIPDELFQIVSGDKMYVFDETKTLVAVRTLGDALPRDMTVPLIVAIFLISLCMGAMIGIAIERG